MPAPFVPQIESDLDLRNIDKMFTKEKPAETPEVSMLLQKKKFEQFTYVENGGALNWEHSKGRLLIGFYRINRKFKFGGEVEQKSIAILVCCLF